MSAAYLIPIAAVFALVMLWLYAKNVGLRTRLEHAEHVIRLMGRGKWQSIPVHVSRCGEVGCDGKCPLDAGALLDLPRGQVKLVDIVFAVDRHYSAYHNEERQT